MPRHPVLPKTPDLFSYSPPTTAPASTPAAAKTREPTLQELSDRALLALLEEVVRELEHRARAGAGRRRQQEIASGIAEALSLLQKLSAKPQTRSLRPREAVQAQLHPAKRRAVRAAFAAGVAPGQVAKHFGLSLAEVRKALADTE